MGAIPIHIYFREHLQVFPTLLNDILLDVSICARFLAAKLIAWEHQDTETSFGIGCMQISHLPVVLGSQASFRSNVHDVCYHTLVFVERNRVAVYVQSAKFEYILCISWIWIADSGCCTISSQ